MSIKGKKLGPNPQKAKKWAYIKTKIIEGAGSGWTQDRVAAELGMTKKNLQYYIKKFGLSWKVMKAGGKQIKKHQRTQKGKGKKTQKPQKPQKEDSGNVPPAAPPPNGAGKLEVPANITEEWVEKKLIHLCFQPNPTTQEVQTTKMAMDWLDKKKALTTVKSEVMNLEMDKVKEFMKEEVRG